MPEPQDPNQIQDPNVGDFITVKGAPAPAADPNTDSPLRKEFGGDFDKLAKSYDELRSKFSGDLGTVKNSITNFEEKFKQLDQITQTLNALQQNLAQPKPAEVDPAQRTSVPDPAQEFVIPGDALYDNKLLTQAVDQRISAMLKSATPQNNQQIEALLQKVDQLAQGYNPQSLETKMNEMMEERLTRMSLEQEKALLLREHSQDVVDLAGYLAYKNGKSSYMDGMELVSQKYPNLIAPKLPPRPELPVDMLSSASSVDSGGVNSLNRQYQGVMDIKTPSQMLMAIK